MCLVILNSKIKLGYIVDCFINLCFAGSWSCARTPQVRTRMSKRDGPCSQRDISMSVCPRIQEKCASIIEELESYHITNESMRWVKRGRRKTKGLIRVYLGRHEIL